MVGDEVADSVEIINHDARDRDSLVYLGIHGNGVPVWLNKRWVDADIRITTGFVEPHFFAGFSGGPKLVAPGLAGLDTVLTLHNAQRIGDRRATWGICEGNPVHDDVRAVVGAVGKVDFALDVVLNREQAIVQAFGGPVLEMHAEARKLTRKLAMSPVPSQFEVVVTTGSGYPLDQNLYQAVKGISAAATVVRPGGTIVCAAECRDGFPDHGSYREVLASAESPKALFDNISQRAETIPDQWQAQIQASLQIQARVVMHTSYLSDAALATAHLEQTADIERTVMESLRRRGPTRGSACSPKDHKPSRTSPARERQSSTHDDPTRPRPQDWYPRHTYRGGRCRQGRGGLDRHCFLCAERPGRGVRRDAPACIAGGRGTGLSARGARSPGQGATDTCSRPHPPGYEQSVLLGCVGRGDRRRPSRGLRGLPRAHPGEFRDAGEYHQGDDRPQRRRNYLYGPAPR